MPQTVLPPVIVSPAQPFISDPVDAPLANCRLTLNGSAWTSQVRCKAQLLIAEDGVNFEERAGMTGIPAHLLNGICAIGIDFGSVNQLRKAKCAVQVSQGVIQNLAADITTS